METKRTSGFVAMMPFGQSGRTDLDWFGVNLARALADKLIAAGLDVISCYKLAYTRQEIHTQTLVNWEEQIRVSEVLHGGHIVTGSYLIDDKRIRINAYQVRDTGFSLIAKEEDTLDNPAALLDRVSQRIVAAFGGAVSASIRDRIAAVSATQGLPAWQALAQAWTAWAAKDLEGVRVAVRAAQELDPEFHEPLDILARATAELDGAEQAKIARKAQLTHLMSAAKPYYRALVIIDDVLAQAQRNGANDLAADCLKARAAVQRNLDKADIAQYYQQRLAQVDEEIELLLDEDESKRLVVLRDRGWTTAQAVSLYLLANSWLQQGEINLQIGRYAAARAYGQRADEIYASLGSAKKRQQAKKLLSAAPAAA